MDVPPPPPSPKQQQKKERRYYGNHRRRKKPCTYVYYLCIRRTAAGSQYNGRRIEHTPRRKRWRGGGKSYNRDREKAPSSAQCVFNDLEIFFFYIFNFYHRSPFGRQSRTSLVFVPYCFQTNFALTFNPGTSEKHSISGCGWKKKKKKSTSYYGYCLPV